MTCHVFARALHLQRFKIVFLDWANWELVVMCMGCAEAVLMSNEGKTPDTTEATLYFAGFAVWFFLLAHFGKKPVTRYFS